MVGCSGGNSEAQAPKALNASPPPMATPVALEPVAVAAEPEDLIAVGRLSKPGPLLDKLGQWSGFPLPWEDLLTQSYPQIKEVLVPEAAVDFAVAIDPGSKSVPDFLGVVSLPLSDHLKGVNALKASGRPNSTDAEGQPYVTLQDKIECTVARSNGPTAARLVCGNHVSLERLTPFVASNLPQQTVGGGDFYAELRLRPIHARYGKRAPLLKMMVPMLLREGSLQNPRFDAALAESAHAVTDDLLVFINEADKLTVGLSLNERTEETIAELGFHFRGSKSFLAAAASHAAQGERVPPPSFWQLPTGTVNASFSSTSPSFDRLAGMSETLGELVAGALEHAGLASGVIDVWVAEFKLLLNAGGASAFGHVTAPGESSAQSLSTALGCEIGAIEGDKGALARFLDATVRVVNDNKLRAEVGKRLNHDLKKLPTINVKAAPARLGLPSAAKVYSLVVPEEYAQDMARVHLGANRKKKQGPLTLQLIVVSQDDRTWFSAGADEALVVGSLKQALTGSTAGSIAEDPTFARWRTTKAASGSTFQLKELFSPSILSGDDGPSAEKIERLRRAMPHGGAHPIHAELTAAADGPSSAVRVIVPRQTLEDIAAAVVGVVAEESSTNGLEQN